MIYFAQMGGSDGPIKIGLSSRPKDRIKDMSTASPYPITLLAVMKGNMFDEARIHEEFASLRLRGEWFRFEGALLALLTAPDAIRADPGGHIVLPPPPPFVVHPETLIAWRKRMGWTIAETAYWLDMREREYRAWERGSREIDKPSWLQARMDDADRRLEAQIGAEEKTETELAEARRRRA